MIRDALVNGVGRLLPTEGIGIPHREGLAVTIEGARFVAEAEEVGVGELLLVNMEAMTLPFDRAGILLENLSGDVGDSKSKRCIARHA
jgi:hypothetical protein